MSRHVVERSRAAIVAALLAMTSDAAANLRAPTSVPSAPSSAAYLHDGAASGTVAREDLSFRCRQNLCRVTARYKARFEAARNVRLEFLLPVNARVTARINDQVTPIELGTASAELPEVDSRVRLHQSYYVSQERLPPLFKAVALAAVNAGENSLVFEYDQPLGSVERGHGYASKGRAVPDFYYLLWPLKEWRLAGDFELLVRISQQEERRSWWGRLFGRGTVISCLDLDGTASQSGTESVWQARLGRSFPDVLYCRFDDH